MMSTRCKYDDYSCQCYWYSQLGACYNFCPEDQARVSQFKDTELKRLLACKKSLDGTQNGANAAQGSGGNPAMQVVTPSIYNSGARIGDGSSQSNVVVTASNYVVKLYNNIDDYQTAVAADTPSGTTNTLAGKNIGSGNNIGSHGNVISPKLWGVTIASLILMSVANLV
ncbi:hypothetical protein AX774_g4416 [Zancudomyces culisetae]|nr:hypothetical protein AX774_g4416 [Zancudomyces culisetae]|eukprot:OMH82119.1 hypothetical protein AX774_g4416 [Zancudomyces culisetae]